MGGSGVEVGILAGLPRLVRAGHETRWRGQAMIALGVASACFWTVVWLIDGPARPLEAGIVFLASLVTSLTVAGVTSRRRFANALATVRPPGAMVHETRADARERHARAAAVILLGAVVLLVVDTLVSDVGATAALLVGAGLGIGTVDRLEARRWAAAEEQRSSRLFLMLRPSALLVRFGSPEVYEVPQFDDPHMDSVPDAF